MDHGDHPQLLRRSPRATHELQQAFEQLQLENNRARHHQGQEDEYSDSDDDFPPPIPVPQRHVDLYNEPLATIPREPPPRSPAHANPLRSHPVAVAGNAAGHTPRLVTAPAPAPAPTPRYRFSHPFREQLYAPRLPDPAPRRHPSNLISYKPVNQRLHPQLRRRTSLDTIASVTTTASACDTGIDESPDVETPSSSMSNLESEYPITPNTGNPPTSEPLRPTSLSELLRATSADSVHSVPPTTPVSSAETHPPKGILRKLKPTKRKDSAGTDGGADKLVIERTVSVDQTSYRSNSSSASNTVSSGTPSRYPVSETGSSRSSSTWTASSHDISGLTAEELKKCKKKGINPSLFAEMKAARKGKWTSPIAGNTFLA